MEEGDVEAGVAADVVVVVMDDDGGGDKDDDRSRRRRGELQLTELSTSRSAE